MDSVTHYQVLQLFLQPIHSLHSDIKHYLTRLSTHHLSCSPCQIGHKVHFSRRLRTLRSNSLLLLSFSSRCSWPLSEQSKEISFPWSLPPSTCWDWCNSSSTLASDSRLPNPTWPACSWHWLDSLRLDQAHSLPSQPLYWWLMPILASIFSLLRDMGTFPNTSATSRRPSLDQWLTTPLTMMQTWIMPSSRSEINLELF